MAVAHRSAGIGEGVAEVHARGLAGPPPQSSANATRGRLLSYFAFSGSTWWKSARSLSCFMSFGSFFCSAVKLAS